MANSFPTAHRVAVVLGLLYLLAVVQEWQAVKYAVKPVVTLAIAWPTRHGQFPMIFRGLLFSTLGDVFLMIPHEHTFVPGLLSFLVAHILYTMSFDTPVRVTWVALPLAGFAAIMLRMLWPGVAGEDAAVRVGVVVYVVAIVIMAYKGVLTRNKVLVVGALLFCVSDSVLAWARFIYPYGWCEFTVMLTYYTAQLCIAAPYS